MELKNLFRYLWILQNLLEQSVLSYQMQYNGKYGTGTGNNPLLNEAQTAPHWHPRHVTDDREYKGNVAQGEWH